MFRLREISRLRIPYPPPLQVYEGYIMCGYLTEFYEEVVLTSREVDVANSAVTAFTVTDKSDRYIRMV